MSKAVDDILGFLRTEQLSMEDQAELIARLCDGEGENHKPAGQWVVTALNGALYSAEESPVHIDWVHGPNIPADSGLVVTFYHGQMDGKPVIQIDGEADFRINVNDCPVWDQSTSVDYSMPEELRDALQAHEQKSMAKVVVREEVKCSHCGMPHHSSYCEDEVSSAQEERVWVGTISDADGVWVYVGATEDALYRDMRSNYGEIEYRDESNYDWTKRVRDIALLNIDRYYVEGER